MPTLALTTRSVADCTADALVLAASAGPDGAVLLAADQLPEQTRAFVTSALATLGINGKSGEVARLVGVPGVKAASVSVAGVGDRADLLSLREAVAGALRSLAEAGAVAVCVPAEDARALGALAEAAYAGVYSYRKSTCLPSAADQPGPGPQITLCSTLGAGKEVKAAVARAEVIGRARDWARDLVNTPPNILFPQSFADEVSARVKASSASVTLSVLTEKQLVKGGFGGIVGVGQGSSRPPRIVSMTYKPSRPAASLAIVGKGITFDSGGLNLKPSAGMVTMKSDMAGAAAAAAALLAIAELGLPVAVTAYLCLAENMPSATAQRPSDVVTMRNGTTVEILDTDAEGRMVLADGICLALESKPDAVVDIATLTGAAVIALGNDIAGVMGADDTFRDRVVTAAQSAGEQAWPMPLPQELRKGLESQTADLAHKADRWGGMLTAGLFLQTFVDDTPWAHVDIAGPAFHESAARGMTPKGGTGFGVGLLVALAEQYAR